MPACEALFYLYLGAIESSSVCTLDISQQSLLSNALKACDGVEALRSLQQKWANNCGVWGKAILFSTYDIHENYVKSIEKIKEDLASSSDAGSFIAADKTCLDLYNSTIGLLISLPPSPTPLTLDFAWSLHSSHRSPTTASVLSSLSLALTNLTLHFCSRGSLNHLTPSMASQHYLSPSCVDYRLVPALVGPSSASLAFKLGRYARVLNSRNLLMPPDDVDAASLLDPYARTDPLKPLASHLRGRLSVASAMLHAVAVEEDVLGELRAVRDVHLGGSGEGWKAFCEGLAAVAAAGQGPRAECAKSEGAVAKRAGFGAAFEGCKVEAVMVKVPSDGFVARGPEWAFLRAEAVVEGGGTGATTGQAPVMTEGRGADRSGLMMTGSGLAAGGAEGGDESAFPLVLLPSSAAFSGTRRRGRRVLQRLGMPFAVDARGGYVTTLRLRLEGGGGGARLELGSGLDVRVEKRGGRVRLECGREAYEADEGQDGERGRPQAHDLHVRMSVSRHPAPRSKVVVSWDGQEAFSLEARLSSSAALAIEGEAGEEGPEGGGEVRLLEWSFLPRQGGSRCRDLAHEMRKSAEADALLVESDEERRAAKALADDVAGQIDFYVSLFDISSEFPSSLKVTTSVSPTCDAVAYDSPGIYPLAWSRITAFTLLNVLAQRSWTRIMDVKYKRSRRENAAWMGGIWRLRSRVAFVAEGVERYLKIDVGKKAYDGLAKVCLEGGSFEALKRGHLRYLSEVGEGALLDRPDVSSTLGEIWLLGIRFVTMVNAAEDIADVPGGETERTGKAFDLKVRELIGLLEDGEVGAELLASLAGNSYYSP